MELLGRKMAALLGRLQLPRHDPQLAAVCVGNPGSTLDKYLGLGTPEKL